MQYREAARTRARGVGNQQARPDPANTSFPLPPPASECLSPGLHGLFLGSTAPAPAHLMGNLRPLQGLGPHVPVLFTCLSPLVTPMRLGLCTCCAVSLNTLPPSSPPGELQQGSVHCHPLWEAFCDPKQNWPPPSSPLEVVASFRVLPSTAEHRPSPVPEEWHWSTCVPRAPEPTVLPAGLRSALPHSWSPPPPPLSYQAPTPCHLLQEDFSDHPAPGPAPHPFRFLRCLH